MIYIVPPEGDVLHQVEMIFVHCLILCEFYCAVRTCLKFLGAKSSDFEYPLFCCPNLAGKSPHLLTEMTLAITNSLPLNHCRSKIKSLDGDRIANPSHRDDFLPEFLCPIAVNSSTNPLNLPGAIK